MLKIKNGYSLTVLIIAIAVIIIITTTAVMSIKNIGQDKEISNFMNDLEEVKQYVVEYFAKNNVLPVLYEGNEMKSAYDEFISLITSGEALSQIDEDDTGDYYYVDITKLGKIHLSNENRGYIVNEGTLNIYVANPCEYDGVKYYTLTDSLTGNNIIGKENTAFEINIAGNPITWTDKAQILVSIPNVRVGEADGWNFKWMKGTKSAGDFRETSSEIVNYFTYGDTITLTENGIYTVYVENPEKVGLVRRVVISKIDNIVPTIKYQSGEIFIDDGQTGVSQIRCKIVQTRNYPIDSNSKNSFPEYYVMSGDMYTDTAEDLLDKYLWEDKNIKGETVEEYLSKYKEYYEQYKVYNAILADPDITSGERHNTNLLVSTLNASYPQFAYDNRMFSDEERNIVVYAEDLVGNATVYFTVNREELMNMQYSAADITSLYDSKALINDDATYTNNRDVTLSLNSLYATSIFATETYGAVPNWEEFVDVSNFTLSEGDGEKTVYVAFKDKYGKTKVVYDKITLDTTNPTSNAPTIPTNLHNFDVTLNQTDSNSGIGSVSYGVKTDKETEYTWYASVSEIPQIYEESTTYSYVTRVVDNAGNEQISNPTSITTGTKPIEENLDRGDYITVEFAEATYPTDSSKTGTAAQNITTNGEEKWRVLHVNAETGEIMITTDGFADLSENIKLAGIPGYMNGPEILDEMCKTLYTSEELGVSARCITLDDLFTLFEVSPEPEGHFAFYPYGTTLSSVSNKTLNGITYTKASCKNANARFYNYDSGGTTGGPDGDGYYYRTPTSSSPVLFTNTWMNYYWPSGHDDIIEILKGSLGDTSFGWVATQCDYSLGGTNSFAAYGIFAASTTRVTYYSLYSNENAESWTEGPGLRPIIVLNAKDIDIDILHTTQTGETADDAWNLTIQN